MERRASAVTSYVEVGDSVRVCMHHWKAGTGLTAVSFLHHLHRARMEQSDQSWTLSMGPWSHNPWVLSATPEP